MWTQDESESNADEFSAERSVRDKLEVANVDGDGLTFLAAKFWLNWIGSNARKGKFPLKYWKSDAEFNEHQSDISTGSQSSKPTITDAVKTDREDPPSSFSLSAKENFKAVLIRFGKKWYRRISFLCRQAMKIIGSFSKLWVSRLRNFSFFIFFPCRNLTIFSTTKIVHSWSVELHHLVYCYYIFNN